MKFVKSIRQRSFLSHFGPVWLSVESLEYTLVRLATSRRFTAAYCAYTLLSFTGNLYRVILENNEK